jgi:hypothetical protein
MHSATYRMKISNKIHTVIKNFEHMFPDQFEKTEIKKCNKCIGGFKDITIGFELEDNICQQCRGLAYYGFDKMYDDIVCKNCLGTGCRYCDNGLITDWLDKVMRPDKRAAKEKMEF